LGVSARSSAAMACVVQNRISGKEASIALMIVGS
jgi:hypothetical protein